MYKHLFKVHTKLCAIAAVIAFFIGVCIGLTGDMGLGPGFFFALMVFFWWAMVCAIFYILSLFFPDGD